MIETRPGDGEDAPRTGLDHAVQTNGAENDMDKITRWILLCTAAVAVTAGSQSVAAHRSGGAGVDSGRGVGISAAAQDTGWG